MQRAMSYTLATAVKTVGLNKSTILKAIKCGQIEGSKDRAPQWGVEPAVLC
jgi:hypothetical protein